MFLFISLNMHLHAENLVFFVVLLSAFNMYLQAGTTTLISIITSYIIK